MRLKYLYLMCGPSGAGKSTWVQRQLEKTNGVWCSRDMVRFNMLEDNEDYFAHEEEVFETWITQIKKALRSDAECIYVDATHLSEKARNKVLNRLDLNGVHIIPVSFEVSLERCLNQNAQREGRAKVPETVIRNMHRTYVPPTMEEKYEYVGIVKVGENDL